MIELKKNLFSIMEAYCEVKESILNKYDKGFGEDILRCMQ